MNKINKKLIIFSALTILFISPIIVMAVPGVFSGTLEGAVANVLITVENILWSVAVAYIIIMFVVAGFKFLTAQGDISKVAEARNAVIWGLVGATVILLAWSIVAIVARQLGV